MRWVYNALDREKIIHLGEQLNISEILAGLLLRVGVEAAPEAKDFLYPRLAHLGDPFLLTGLKKVAQRISEAIDANESIVVFGDYDVDGVTSTTLLVDALRQFGNHPRFVVPRRLKEGYGLSKEAITRALAEGAPTLFIALDCGTNSVDEIAHIRSRGTEVIVIDHHRSKEKIPEDCLMVNPHVYEDAEEIRHFCTVGLVFKVIHGLLKLRREMGDSRAFEIKIKDYLDLVAMGTVADMVPLVAENRVFASHGLKILPGTKRPGLRSLMHVSGIRRGDEMRPVDVSFKLGPRINASGRLSDAALSVELLLSDDAETCSKIARELDGFNCERQEIERKMTVSALEQVGERDEEKAGLVLYGDDWHPGVVGILASRLSRKYNCPCIVLGREEDLAKGSGRSANGINLVEVLAECGDLLESWGGHPMAVGVSLKTSNVAALQERFAIAVEKACEAGMEESTIEIAQWLELNQIKNELMNELDLIHPFGQSNEEPVFASKSVQLASAPIVFKEHHFRFHLKSKQGRSFAGVAWKMADSIPPFGELIDVAYKLSWNRYNGRKTIQLELVSWKLAE
ncbi:MAG: single-stranded-DNA-specific exonuclease RecJ [Opitutaceae bacterium]|nr:single-stranded-DNA-specific exonuclease RecJ [Opitutaceae bacterium]